MMMAMEPERTTGGKGVRVSPVMASRTGRPKSELRSFVSGYRRMGSDTTITKRVPRRETLGL